MSLGLEHSISIEQTDGDHGRIETRKLWVCWDVQALLGDVAEGWPGLKALIRIERTREVEWQDQYRAALLHRSLDKRTKARRLFDYIRGHWSVENNLHWQLDVSFREDERRIREGPWCGELQPPVPDGA